MTNKLHCSFCGKGQHEVTKLIAGPSTFICNECVDLCVNIISDEGAKAGTKTLNGVPTPQEIVALLDEHVVGQTDAKEWLALAAHNHVKRTKAGKTSVELQKSNVALIGPSGSGKTLLVQSLAKILDVPVAIADATSLTEAGYVGDDVESVLTKLLVACGFDTERAKHGIVFIDEIDKKRNPSGANLGITRDVSGQGVQQALLKMLEGNTVKVPAAGGRKHPQADGIELDTSNILFIVGGAFAGIGDFIHERTKGEEPAAIGFGGVPKGNRKKPNEAELMKDVTPEDLINYGMMREFVGRFPIITATEELTVEVLKSILTQPKNALMKQKQVEFSLSGAKLEWTDDGLAAVAQEALDRKVGARGLRTIVEKALKKAVFDAAVNPGCTVTLTAESGRPITLVTLVAKAA
jgi:ATP-dependent Clp protease ATP-binding subunit ClpX